MDTNPPLLCMQFEQRGTLDLSPTPLLAVVILDEEDDEDEAP